MSAIRKVIGALILLLPAVAAPRVEATIGCNLFDDPRYPRASLLIENNLSLPVEITASWITPDTRAYPIVNATRVAPLTERRFLYGLSIGRNVVRLRIVVDGNIYASEQSVFVNNELAATCQRTYKVIVTQRTFPGAIIATEPRPVTARYIGCFADNKSAAAQGTAGRDLDGSVWNHPQMSVNACIQHCRQGGFAFAGVQYRTWCFCGNRHGRHGGSNACTMPCPGNAREYCGGEWASNVYALK